MQKAGEVEGRPSEIAKAASHGVKGERREASRKGEQKVKGKTWAPDQGPGSALRAEELRFASRG